MMNWNDFWNAFDDARNTMRQADLAADSMAIVLCGRLRKCNGDTLAKLKRELRDFNIQTHKWKDEP